MTKYEQEVNRITNRHIAICLSKLEEVECPQIIKDIIKRNYWYLSDDLKNVKIEQECKEDDNNGKQKHI